jgi:hypothetical protein
MFRQQEHPLCHCVRLFPWVIARPDLAIFVRALLVWLLGWELAQHVASLPLCG